MNNMGIGIVLVAMIGVFVLLVIWQSVTVSINKSVSGFANASESFTSGDNAGVVANPQSVPAAQPVATFTHITNTTGSMVMTNTNHGIITGQRIDIYWPNGQCYGAIAGTVSGTTVPIASVSGGSNLPATNTTGVVVGICVAVAFGITGNNMDCLVLTTPQTGYFVFNASGTDDAFVLVQAGRVYTWDTNASNPNPLAGLTPTGINMSHNYVTSAIAQMQAVAVTH